MSKDVPRQAGSARDTVAVTGKRLASEEGLVAARRRILENTTEMRILEPSLVRELIRERQERGIDGHDEVWDGVYVMPPLANNPHQALAANLTGIFFNVITLEGRGAVFAGANISDRRQQWEHNFRAPDVVVVLNGGRAVDCDTHWMSGPDFLVEVQSPRDDTEEKIPFYSSVHVRELLIVHRDTRELRLLRHDGRQLAPVEPSNFHGKKYLVSAVLPLAFRRVTRRGTPRTEVRRTDDTPGSWTV